MDYRCTVHGNCIVKRLYKGYMLKPQSHAVSYVRVFTDVKGTCSLVHFVRVEEEHLTSHRDCACVDAAARSTLDVPILIVPSPLRI
jgi:hypothetical protein